MMDDIKSSIDEFERKERNLMVQSVSIVKEGGVFPDVYKEELIKIRAELKRLRRIRTMQENRAKPLLDVGVRVNFDASEYRRLSDNAAKAAMTLNNYIRHLLKMHG